MKKFYFSGVMTAIALCLVTNGVYAMRSAEGDPEGAPPPKRQKLLEQSTPKTTTEEVSELKDLFFQSTYFLVIHPHLSSKEKQILRSACTETRDMVDAYTYELDLSPRTWVPMEVRQSWRQPWETFDPFTERHTGVKWNYMTMFPYENVDYLSLCRGKIPFYYLDSTGQHQTYYYDTYFNFSFTDLTVDFEKFPNLQSLNLCDNTVVTVEDLSHVKLLKRLELGDKINIPLSDLRFLVQLEELVVWGDERTDFYEFVHFPKLKKLTLAGERGVPYQLQALMNLIDGLFSALKQEEKLNTSPELRALEDLYIQKVLLPNEHHLFKKDFHKKFKTIHEWDVTSYQWGFSVQEYLLELQAMGNHDCEAMHNVLDSKIPFKLITQLIEMRGKELEIYYAGDSCDTLDNIKDLAKDEEKSTEIE
jgi:hypothetical protein